MFSIYKGKGYDITCIGLVLLKVRSANLHLFPWVPLLIHTTVSSSSERFVINFKDPDKKIWTDCVHLRDAFVF